MQFSAHTKYFKHSFFPHLTAKWNTLHMQLMVFMYILTYLTHLSNCSVTHILTCNLVLILNIFSIPFPHIYLPNGTPYLVLSLLHHLFLFSESYISSFSIIEFCGRMYQCTFTIGHINMCIIMHRQKKVLYTRAC